MHHINFPALFTDLIIINANKLIREKWLSHTKINNSCSKTKKHNIWNMVITIYVFTHTKKKNFSKKYCSNTIKMCGKSVTLTHSNLEKQSRSSHSKAFTRWKKITEVYSTNPFEASVFFFLFLRNKDICIEICRKGSTYKNCCVHIAFYTNLASIRPLN